MPKVTKNHLNANQIDFGYTALNSVTYPSMQMKLTDTIEYYDVFGNIAATYTVQQIVDFIKANELNFMGEEEVCINESPFEKEYKSRVEEVYQDELEYLDDNFDEVTQLFLMLQLDKKEARHAA